MKCCHCSNNAIRVIDGTTLCLSCHTDFQNLSHNQISSTYQAQRGSDVAYSMFLRAAAQNAERRIKNDRNTEVNNYNITVQGNNSGFLQAGKSLTQNNIGINNLSKSSNDNVGWLAKIIDKGIQIAKFCLKLMGFFR